jgi:hypothetical protein
MQVTLDPSETKIFLSLTPLRDTDMKASTRGATVLDMDKTPFPGFPSYHSPMKSCMTDVLRQRYRTRISFSGFISDDTELGGDATLSYFS